MDFSKVQFHPNWQNLVAPPPQVAPTTPVKQKGKGGWLSSIISELGGAGGAAGGAAYGASIGSILPGAGTLVGGLIGAGLGGFLGGTGGRLVENKVRDNNFQLGNSLKEGALSGVLGAGGEAFTGLRAAKAAGIGVKEALQTAPADLQLAKAAVRSGQALKGGERVTADAMNLLPGTKVGSHTLSTNEAKQLSAHVGSITKALNPEQQLADLEAHISATGKQIGDVVQQGNRALTKAELDSLTAEAQGAIGKVAGLGEDKKAVQQFVKDLGNVKDLQGLQTFRQSVADQINFGKVGGVKPGTQQALRNLRGVVAPFVDNNVPGLADANKAFSLSKDALPFVQHNVANPKGIGIPIKGPFGKLSISGRGATATKNLAGKLLPGGGGDVGGGIFKQQLKLKGAAGLAGALNQFGGQSPTQDPSQDFSGALGVDPSQQVSQPQSQPTYSLQNALMDARRDPKNAAQYLAYAKAFESQSAATNKGVKLSAPQQLRKDSISSALGSLDSAVQNLTAAGGAQGPKGNLATIPVIGQYLDHNGAAYHQTKIELATALAKAVTGGSRPAGSVIQQYLHSLPDVNDTPAFAQAKVTKLQNDLYAQAKRFGFHDLLPGAQSNDQSSSLADILSAYGGQ